MSAVRKKTSEAGRFAVFEEKKAEEKRRAILYKGLDLPDNLPDWPAFIAANFIRSEIRHCCLLIKLNPKERALCEEQRNQISYLLLALDALDRVHQTTKHG